MYELPNEFKCKRTNCQIIQDQCTNSKDQEQCTNQQNKLTPSVQTTKQNSRTDVQNNLHPRGDHTTGTNYSSMNQHEYTKEYTVRKVSVDSIGRG